MCAFSPWSRPCMCLGILRTSTDTTTPPMGAFQQQLTTLPSSSQQQHNSLSFFRSYSSFILSLSLFPFLFFPSQFSSIFLSFSHFKTRFVTFCFLLISPKSLLYNSPATIFLSVSFYLFFSLSIRETKIPQ